MRALLAELKFRTDRRGDKHQVFITAWAPYDTRVLPDANAIGLPPTDRLVRAQLHVAVSPIASRAVAIGSILEIERNALDRRVSGLLYGSAAIDRWFFESLDIRSGVCHQPMAPTFAAPVQQARELMPPGRH